MDQYLYVYPILDRQAGASYKIFLDENKDPAIEWDL